MAYDVYRGFRVTYNQDEPYKVIREGRMVYSTDSYDDALLWIDNYFAQIAMAQLSYGGY
jgi:hypothetical protein